MCSNHKILFSKTSLLSLMAVCGVSWLLMLGCAKEDEKPKTVEKLSTQSLSFPCFKDFSNTLDRFLMGDLPQSEIEAFWKCADTAITTFEDVAYGPSPGEYLASDLKKFLQDFFLKNEFQISDQLLLEAMKVKQLFLGGRTDLITRQELLETRSVISFFSELTVELGPQMGFLVKPMLVSQQVKSKDLTRARGVLVRVVAKLSDRLSQGKTPFDVGGIDRLLREMNPEKPSSISKYFPAVGFLKAWLVGGAPLLITPKEWRLSLSLLSDILVSAVQMKAIVSPGEWYAEDPQLALRGLLKTLDVWVSRGMATEGEVTGVKKEKFIGLVRILRGLGFELGPMKDEEILGLASHLMGFMAPSEKPSPAMAWTLPQWITLQKITDDYFIRQHRVLHLAPTSPVGADSILGQLTEADMARLRTLSRILRGPASLNIDGYHWLHLSPVSAQRNYTISTLSWLNLESFVTDLLMVRAGVNLQDKKPVLSPPQVRAILEKLGPLLQLLGISASGVTELAALLSRDANLFMPSSDGDFVPNSETFQPLVSGPEMTEFIHYVLAAFFQVKTLDKTTGLYCGERGLKLPSESAGCLLRTVLDRSASTVYPNIKVMSEFLDSLPLNRNQGIVDSLCGILGNGTANSGDASLSLKEVDPRVVCGLVRSPTDTNFQASILPSLKLSMVLFYVETLMLRFDENESSLFEYAEALVAFDSLYVRPLGSILGQDPVEGRNELLMIFTYILKYGRSPVDTADPLRAIRIDNWKRFPNKWQSLSVSRDNIIELLAILSKY